METKVQFTIQKGGETDTVIFQNKPTYSEVERYFDEKCGGVYEWWIFPEIQQIVFPFVLKLQIDELRKAFLSFQKTNNSDWFYSILNKMSRWFINETDKHCYGRHIVIIGKNVFMLPNDVYMELNKLDTELCVAKREAKEDEDGWYESNNLSNYKEWIKRHYAPINIEADIFN